MKQSSAMSTYGFRRILNERGVCPEHPKKLLCIAAWVTAIPTSSIFHQALKAFLDMCWMLAAPNLATRLRLMKPGCLSGMILPVSP
ncbi:hypothetical protein D3871_11405 [Noviherbaspirillum saxi]|uniref:Uncharacterized protein n=1 Tax=Noviherbaspirillum saxi TaxID=2320863 RepID=A0A3A3FXX2_9BURK|nr:hypothetical protein D3871_11405 [Noviherbaspirillum saxi]